MGIPAQVLSTNGTGFPDTTGDLHASRLPSLQRCCCVPIRITSCASPCALSALSGGALAMLVGVASLPLPWTSNHPLAARDGNNFWHTTLTIHGKSRLSFALDLLANSFSFCCVDALCVIILQMGRYLSANACPPARHAKYERELRIVHE